MAHSIWIMAGEPSGDAYGARLAGELRALQPGIVLRGMGGAAMREAGVDLLVDSTDLAVVGLIEVLKHLPTFARIFRQLVNRAAAERPSAVVLIDYPGFNLRFAEKLHGLGIRTVYYVSPQVWAWGKRRIPKLARVVDKMLVIFPFETDVFAGTGLDVAFVGHPLLEILRPDRNLEEARAEGMVVLLPGSRRAEVTKMLPPIYRTARWLAERRPQLRFVLPVPNERLLATVEGTLAKLARQGPDHPQIDTVIGGTREWLRRGEAGLAASGTVTVESAILGLPLVVIYRVNWLTYWLARALVRIPFFCMVNVVAGRRIYDEFLQGELRPGILGPAVEAIMQGGERRAEVERGMAECVAVLGKGENVCRNAAQAVLDVL